MWTAPEQVHHCSCKSPLGARPSDGRTLIAYFLGFNYVRSDVHWSDIIIQMAYPIARYILALLEIKQPFEFYLRSIKLLEGTQWGIYVPNCAKRSMCLRYQTFPTCETESKWWAFCSLSNGTETNIKVTFSYMICSQMGGNCWNNERLQNGYDSINSEQKEDWGNNNECTRQVLLINSVFSIGSNSYENMQNWKKRKR